VAAFYFVNYGITWSFPSLQMRTWVERGLNALLKITTLVVSIRSLGATLPNQGCRDINYSVLLISHSTGIHDAKWETGVIAMRQRGVCPLANSCAYSIVTQASQSSTRHPALTNASTSRLHTRSNWPYPESFAACRPWTWRASESSLATSHHLHSLIMPWINNVHVLAMRAFGNFYLNLMADYHSRPIYKE